MLSSIFSPPKPPDPTQTAAAQQKLNLQTATSQQELNQINQTNPYGSLTYKQTGTNADGTPQFTADTQFSAPMAGLFGTQTANQQGMGNAASGLINSGAGAFGGKPLDLGWNATEAKLDALGAKTIDPQMAQAKTKLDADLAGRGIAPGSEQWQIQQDQFGRDKAAAYDNMYLTGHNTAVNDLKTSYEEPVTMASTLMGGAQPTAPTFTNTPQTGVQGTDMMGMVNQNYQTQAKAQQAALGGLFSAVGTIGGAAMGNPMALIPKSAGQAGYSAMGGVSGYA